MHDIAGEHWHPLPAGDAVKFFGSDVERGLDLFEIENRQRRFGPNIIAERKGRGPIARFFLQVHQPLIYILVASAIITAILGEWVDSAVIWGIVIINATIGFVQETKALTAIAALKRVLTSEATVMRAGLKSRIPSSELVPGDVVMLASGDKVPADLRLVNVRDLQVDESALTGESVPVIKQVDQVSEAAVLADRKDMAYMSTLVTYGTGTGVVVSTGDNTEIGQISEMIASAKELATPLTLKIEHFSKYLLIGIMALAGITLGIGLIRGHSLYDTFMAAVALAVGAIPEGLPAAVTIILAIGVSRMAKRHSIIRRLPAVETLGSTTVICTDKTGTLTKNQMTVQKIFAAGETYELSGAGYSPNGEITKDGVHTSVNSNSALLECITAGLLCNDAELSEEEGRWKVHGDPTEGALIVSAHKSGIDTREIKSKLKRIDAIPFESQRHYMATLHRGDGSTNIAYLKGSMEALLSRCTMAMDSSGSIKPIERDSVKRAVDGLAGDGLRVLLLARKDLPPDLSAIHESDVEDALTFLGLQAMIDPPRPEAVQAVDACHRAGVDVKMITGDHAITAASISKKLNILPGASIDFTSSVLTGKDLETIPDQELTKIVGEAEVFARMNPEQKFRLVEALQAGGQVVAMTGDGVNDAPALKRADIGISMGKAGTEVAREASDMVLTDDNFATIEAAIEEGRGVFDNLLKFIVWTIPANLGEGLVLLLAIFLGIAIPILPVQILWINMTTAGCLGLMYAFEPKEADIMERRPRDPKTPLLTMSIAVRIALVSVLLALGSFFLYHWAIADGLSQTVARTVAVNVFVIGELFYLFSCRSLGKSIFAVGLFTNVWVWLGVAISIALQLTFTYAPFMNRLFHSAPFGINEWLKIIAVGSIISVVVGIDKWVVNLIAKKG